MTSLAGTDRGGAAGRSFEINQLFLGLYADSFLQFDSILSYNEPCLVGRNNVC